MRPLCILALAALGAAWAPAQFLPVGDVSAFVLPSNATGPLLAGASAGVFYSGDAGAHWQRTGLTHVNAMAAGPAGTLYAATNFSIAKSTDGGLSWTDVRSPGCAHLVAVSPGDFSILYADTCGSGIVKSTNSGRTWTPLNTAFAPKAVIWDLAFDPDNAATLYVATGSGVFKTTDAGQTWAAPPATPVRFWTYCVAIDPVNHRRLYAGTNGRGILLSTDAGASWVPLDPAARITVQHLAIDPANPDIVYAATQRAGVLKSTDAGRSWMPVNSGMPEGPFTVLHIAIDPKQPHSLYAGMFGYGVYHSTDAGASWKPLNAGLQSAGVLAIAVDPVEPNIIYAGTDSLGVFKSTDAGAHWTRSNAAYAGRGLIRALGISAAWPVPRVYTADLNDGIFQTPNGGDTWARAPWTRQWIPQPKNWPNIPDSIALDPSRPDLFYVAVYSAGVFRSVDAGRSWKAINNGIANLRIDSVILDPADSTRLFAVGTQTIYRTDNGGESWNSSPLPFHARALAISGEGATRGVWYAGGRGMFKSTDAGRTWTASDYGLPRPVLIRCLAVDPTRADTVYAGTEGSGLYKTTDGGKTWAAIGAP